jgi:hypothetical protein
VSTARSAELTDSLRMCTLTTAATVKASNLAVLITAAAVNVHTGSVDSTDPGTPIGQPVGAVGIGPVP